MEQTLFINGKIILQDRILEQGSLLAADGRIKEIRDSTGEKSSCRVVDLQGNYLAPGFVDIHVHGGGGGDFMDGERDSWDQALRTHLDRKSVV